MYPLLKGFLLLMFALTTVAQAKPLGPGTLPGLLPSQQQSQAATLAAEVLTRYHYKAMPLDDAMSSKIFDRYLKELDPEKLIFVQGDIDDLERLRRQLDDAIVEGNLAAPFSIFNLYRKRVVERFAYARALLKEGFDFRQHEDFPYTREKAAWPRSEMEMREVWRKRVKNDWLRLKLAGKDNKATIEILNRRYESTRLRVKQQKSDDAFQVFMNAYTMSIEPHTNYMGPRAAEEFGIAMKLSLVGIGAALAEKDDYTVVRELVPGGPAALSGQLKVGDRILGVAQGTGAAMADVQGQRLDDIVALIRGPLDSTVLLEVARADDGPDAKHQLVTLVRKKISLEEQSAKKSVIAVKDGNVTRHIGVISLPSFYEDGEARQRGELNFKSATRDVLQLLNELKRENVDGVLVDLRNNGGGSLAEAIELTGLFTGKGPVVQTRDAKGNVVVSADGTVDMAWDGPLGVVINRGSASASEIFAAAIQDYGRGLIIGEQSFGKGTVQTMVDLDQIAKNDKSKFGELKLTIAQFFRVNGGTTQLRGVSPDVRFPAVADAAEFGESSFDNALPWMQVKAADYSPIGDVKNLTPILISRHDARVRSDRGFSCLSEKIADIRHQRERNLVSLNETERRRQHLLQEARQTSCEARNDAENSAGEASSGNTKALQDDGLQGDERSLSRDLAEESARKNAKDVMLNEAVHIVSDEAGLLKSARGLAANLKP